jgi:hypothetical protein
MEDIIQAAFEYFIDVLKERLAQQTDANSAEESAWQALRDEYGWRGIGKAEEQIIAEKFYQLFFTSPITKLLSCTPRALCEATVHYAQVPALLATPSTLALPTQAISSHRECVQSPAEEQGESGIMGRGLERWVDSCRLVRSSRFPSYRQRCCNV